MTDETAKWYRMNAPDPDDVTTWTVKDGPWPYAKAVERGGWQFWEARYV